LTNEINETRFSVKIKKTVKITAFASTDNDLPAILCGGMQLAALEKAKVSLHQLKVPVLRFVIICPVS